MYRTDSSFAPRMLILPAALASAFALTGALPAYAQSTVEAPASKSVHWYDLSSGSLARTLDAIAATSGRPIAFIRKDVEQGRANAVRGNLSASAAIAQAVAGTGYILNEDGVGTLAVTPATQVVVTAKRDEAETSFKASRSDTATRSGTSLHLVPGGVTLITGKVLETQQATNLTDSLRNVSGMYLNQSPQSTTTFTIRGFAATSNSNGVTDSTATTRGVYAVERIEVLKGPQAILSGSGSLGGSVNIVVKKPQAEPIRDVTLQYGTHNDKTAAVDLSGAITADKRLTYRTVASIADASSSDAGMNGRNEKSFMQAMRWKDKNTDLIVNAEFNKGHTPLMRYTFARRDGVILPVPDRLLGHPDDGFDALNRKVSYQLEQRLSNNATLISRTQYTRSEFDLHVPTPAGLSYAPGAQPNAPRPNMTFFSGRTIREDETTSGDHYLRLALQTGPVRHKLSVGLNHTSFAFKQHARTGTSYSVPVYESTPFEFQDMRDRAANPSSDGNNGLGQQAAYLQDLMSYEKWNLLVNLRRNRYTLDDSSSTFYPSNLVSFQPGSKSYSTTPGAGLVYQLNDQTALYASYGEGFLPQTSLRCGGGIVPPRETRSRELGAKFDLLDSRLALTTSVFSMQESNRLVFFRAGNCYDVREAQRTKGLEIDAQGRLAPGLETVFNYTYTRSKDVTLTTTAFAGQPKHKMSMWTIYDFQSPALKGLGIGVGLSANSWAYGNTNATEQFIVPGQAQIDASVNYKRGPWVMTLGVKNLADRTLYATTVSNAFVPVLPGREFMLTVKHSFK
ncbi:TonB-dependent siderophore receptor [Massilia sp. LjRoot122]|uniref:TonB-dependent siderophore receptor n=1 Tax=Massilia sp. LjRoot122 TaxID=3342257 RepID=UPI003ECF3503